MFPVTISRSRNNRCEITCSSAFACVLKTPAKPTRGGLFVFAPGWPNSKPLQLVSWRSRARKPRSGDTVMVHFDHRIFIRAIAGIR